MFLLTFRFKCFLFLTNSKLLVISSWGDSTDGEGGNLGKLSSQFLEKLTLK